MRILKITVTTLALLSAIFLIGGFVIPEQWEVSRSAMINAKSDQIYPLVASFKEWDKWSPWNSSKDPSLKFTYEGPQEGKGAKQSWVGESMGKGWMVLTEASPQKGIAYDLFIDMGSNQTTLHGSMVFVSKEEMGEKTEVQWTDKGNSGSNIISRWMSFIFRPILGKEMETGLAGLKTMVESKIQS